MSGSADFVVSVIIPVYNGARHLWETVTSALVQTQPPCEILVVDDGSTDESAAVIQQMAATSAIPIRYSYQTNGGPGAARNKGIALASGGLVAFLDQDDLWLENKLARQVQLFQDAPDVDIVVTQQVYFLADGFACPPWVRPELLDRPVSAMTPSTLMVRRHLFNQIGTFSEKLLAASDADWFFRAKDAGIVIAAVSEVLVKHRIHSQNQSRMVARSHMELLALVQQSVRRKQMQSL